MNNFGEGVDSDEASSVSLDDACNLQNNHAPEIIWMYQCKLSDQKKLLRELFDVGSIDYEQESAGLRGNILFMCMAYYDHFELFDELKSFLFHLVNSLQTFCIDRHDKTNELCFWLANLEYLLSSMTYIDEDK
eukprot:Pgem_evm1s11899